MVRLLAHPHPVRKLSLFLGLPVCRRSSLPTEEGDGEFGPGAESYDRKKALPSINRSILSLHPFPRGRREHPRSVSPTVVRQVFAEGKTAKTSHQEAANLPQCLVIFFTAVAAEKEVCRCHSSSKPPLESAFILQAIKSLEGQWQEIVQCTHCEAANL
jgi:hypothetical protein